MNPSKQEWVEWTKVHEAVFNNKFGDSSEDIAFRLGINLAAVCQATKDVAKYMELSQQEQVSTARQGLTVKVLLPVNR